MKILFLGTGTSTGIPQIGCNCAVCQSTDSRDKRLRTSVLITHATDNVLIDCGPDFRQQMLLHKIPHITSILLTHEHYDHVCGLDEVRPFREVDVYAEERVLGVLKRNMPYIFSANPYPGAPQINLHEISNFDSKFQLTERSRSASSRSLSEVEVQVPSFEIQPVRLLHYKLPILGYRIGNFAYLTDFSAIDEAECEKLQGVDVLVVDALRKFSHHAHMTLDEALALVEKLKPNKAYFTHMSHDMGLHEEVQKLLPENVFLAWDGLELSV